MPIDFTLTPEQRELQQSARQFARNVLAGVAEATRHLPTPAERFAATRPFYEQVIRGGFLRRLIPVPCGGEGTGMLDMAVVAEEFQSVDVNVSLTMFGALLGLPRPANGIVVERLSDSMGHRAHLTPRFRIENVRVPKENVLGPIGGGLELVEASFAGTAALVGVFGVALMRAAFDFALNFARTEHRGGIAPIIEHQAVGYALADAKTAIEAARYLSWKAFTPSTFRPPARLSCRCNRRSSARKQR